MEQINGFEGLYEIHAIPQKVWSVKFKRYLKSYITNKGYYSIKLYKNGIRTSHLIHKLIADHFITKPEDGLLVDHININKKDNRLQNLRYLTDQKNKFNTNAKGYSFNKRNKKYESYIKLNHKKIFGGYFDTKEEAHNKYLELKKIYHII